MFDIKTKLLLRKINKQLAIFISAVFIVTLAVLFFVAVKTVYRDFKLSAENYFENNLLDDLVLFGIFTEDDIKTIKDINGVERAEGRHRFQGKIEKIKKENKKRIDITLDENLIKIVDDITANRSEFISLAINEYVESHYKIN